MLENNKNDDKKIQNIISEIQKDNFESVALKYSISSSASNNGDLDGLAKISVKSNS